MRLNLVTYRSRGSAVVVVVPVSLVVPMSRRVISPARKRWVDSVIETRAPSGATQERHVLSPLKRLGIIFLGVPQRFRAGLITFSPSEVHTILIRKRSLSALLLTPAVVLTFAIALTLPFVSAQESQPTVRHHRVEEPDENAEPTRNRAGRRRDAEERLLHRRSPAAKSRRRQAQRLPRLVRSRLRLQRNPAPHRGHRRLSQIRAPSPTSSNRI